MAVRKTYRFPFARYPAVRLALLLMAGIIIAERVDAPFWIPVLVCLLLAVVFLGIELSPFRKPHLSRTRLSVGLSLLLIIAFGWLRSELNPGFTKNITEVIVALSEWEEVQVTGVVMATSRNMRGSQRADLKVTSIRFESGTESGESFISRLLITEEEVFEGDTVFFKGTVIPVSERRNPLQFDYKKYLADRGIRTQIRMDSLTSYSENEQKTNFAWWRKKSLALVERNFDARTAPIAKALLLGYKQDLEGESRQAFARAGLSHIMAVSGLHVGFIVAPFWILMPLLWSGRKGKWAGFLLLVLILWVYAGITGFSASVMRASVTALFLTWGKLFNKAPNSINLTGAAAFFLLLIEPDQLFEVGFQLSFSAVFIILLVLPVIQHFLPYWMRTRWYAKPLMVVIVSLVVQLGLYPLQVYYFGEVSLISPLANALFVPLLGVIVPLSLICLIISALTPVIGFALNLPGMYFLGLMDEFVRFSSSLDWAWMEASLSTLLLFPFWVLVIFTVASWRTPALRWGMLIVALLLFNLMQLEAVLKQYDKGDLTVTIFDVGQGDGALIQTPNGKQVLIDAGVWSPGRNSGETILLPHLKEAGIDRLNAVILSHPHADHIGGIPDLLKEIEIEVIYNAGYEYDSNLYREYIRLAGNKEVPLVSVKAGDILDIDPSVLFLVMGPDGERYNDDPNQHSVVVNVIYGESEFLFTGDAGEEQEERLVEHYGELLDTDFLKAGHHGSRTSSGVELLESVTPEIAVVSLAEQNKFRHPHQEAVFRLSNTQAELFYTSRDRALIFRSDGRSIHKEDWYE